MSRGLACILAVQGLQTTIGALNQYGEVFGNGTRAVSSCSRQMGCSTSEQQSMIGVFESQQQQQQQQEDQSGLDLLPRQQQPQQRGRTAYQRGIQQLSSQQHCCQNHTSLSTLMDHKQASLMQQSTPLQQPWGQPNSNLFRTFSSSTPLLASKRHAWMHPMPHEPSKHIPGRDPLKVVKAASSVDSTLRSSNSSTSEPAAAEAAVAQETHPRFSKRLRAAISRQWQSVRQAGSSLGAELEGLPWQQMGTAAKVCILTASCMTAAYVLTKCVVLGGTPGNLRSNDPELQKLAVNRLRSMIGLLPPGYDDMAQQIVHAGLLQELSALIRPGTDAVVLITLCKLLNELLDQGGTIQRDMIKAGVADALAGGLQEGWLPKGAVEAVTSVSQRLTPPVVAAQRGTQRWWQRGKPDAEQRSRASCNSQLS